MRKELTMKFNYRGSNNELLTEVTVNPFTKKVTFVNHTDLVYDKAFAWKENVTYDDVLAFFEERTIPRNRDNINEILKELGMKEYDPYLLCKHFGGKMAHDDNWIEFLD